MDNNVLWYRENQISRLIKNLDKNNMQGYYVKDKEKLIEILKGFLAEGSTIGIGDSMTLFQLGIIDFLREGKFNFLDKYREGITREEKEEIYIKNFSCDTFLSSSNAITENGELFNIDGNGSRVAPMIYGPKQVIIVIGINKIVKNLEEAEKRVRRYAAPIDAKRLGKETPCTKLGYCVDCSHEQRICNDFVSIRGQFIKGRIKVIIVEKELGY
ncbi:lactate utilization protein [Anaerovorax odorimutans]|uniref:lactate utilization protein n=1 Tax=Anaerovorax odorimutans TaxID=109327 RepID=UPI00040C5BA8|nr:lactate utilization protein [Anaerovorax odorimutans]